MPILAAEPSLFPANLLDDHIDEGNERSWFAVYTKSRQEKSLARQLLGMEVPFYLPLIPKTRASAHSSCFHKRTYVKRRRRVRDLLCVVCRKSRPVNDFDTRWPCP